MIMSRKGVNIMTNLEKYTQVFPIALEFQKMRRKVLSIKPSVRGIPSDIWS